MTPRPSAKTRADITERSGTVFVHRDVVMGDSLIMRAIRAELRIVRADFNPVSGYVSYIGYCEQFEVVKPHMSTPIYRPRLKPGPLYGIEWEMMAPPTPARNYALTPDCDLDGENHVDNVNAFEGLALGVHRY